MSENDTSNSLGKLFIWFAWLIVIALLVFFFQDMLENQWNPNSKPDIYLSNQGKAEVHLEQNRHGHYVVNGTINQQPVTFLLDTGATQVSIPAHIAENLNLTSQGSHRVSTANGSITVYQTSLDQLSIGNIILHNVGANINPAMKTNEILLGMSALKRVEFRQTGKTLILTEQ
ncbi:retropepsin-like aspartic protease family protein [Thalassotalea sp. PLHSN55]|uniref:retropepsin-like aspartic protease family protein n=1 Tax=Thalassotalea sp. PLHSN55 TaxID=3435888 RepID=UPI003F82E2BC